ncbi:toxin-antitoxin system YwqK family antitoxin [Yeosuana marina]|uniref:toxin-antitoxin system YwqK family antitoxin n=1 Tax=Yeosuana marina TaxID=1565536 RepID=UPI001422C50D|nr:hypothetical protein [Yeosuana marina]
MQKMILALVLITFLKIGLYAQTINNYDHCNCTETINYSDAHVVDGLYQLLSNGKIIEKGNYLDGVKDGTWVVNNTNGVLISKIEYSNGKLNGDYELFYFEGQPKLIAKFENNLPVGDWKYFSRKGKIIKKGSYANGKPIGTWNIFKDNGKKIIAEYDFDNKKSIVSNDNAKIKKSYLPRDDESGEYIIIYYPKRTDKTKIKPLGGFIQSGEYFIDLINVPLVLMNTYTSYHFEVKAEVKSGLFSIKEVTYNSNAVHNYKLPSLPFIAQTNSPKNLNKIEHKDFLKFKMKERIFEILMVLGPWVSESDSDIDIQIPFVLNEIN